HVAFSPVGPPQTTFTDAIALFLSFFTSRPSILKGAVSTVKLSRTCTSSASITCDGSAMYFLNWDT
ncbi:hypothetical protein A2U01_0115860, partial [Trifolium medium]|nr:hypothetical protein [Trifolium medium]